MEVVALYGVGVVVRVPSPARYAVHKLIVAGRRDTTNPKCSKDLRQAQDLMSILSDLDEASLEDAIEDGRSKGRTWKTTINAALKSLGLQLHLDAKQLRS